MKASKDGPIPPPVAGIGPALNALDCLHHWRVQVENRYGPRGCRRYSVTVRHGGKVVTRIRPTIVEAVNAVLDVLHRRRAPRLRMVGGGA